MNRLKLAFAQGHKAFIPFLMAGDPDLKTTKELIFALADAGADIIELGIPFSDPLADGPVIQAAANRALKANTTTAQVLQLVKECRQAGLTKPIVFLVYYNLIYNMGEAQFIAGCSDAGVDGLVIPDLPLEEMSNLRALANRAAIELILLASPTTTPTRLAAIVEVAKGFIYCVSTTGVTGVRTGLPEELAAFLKRIRTVTDLPLAVGFGIGTPQQAQTVAQFADGVIVGSALVEAAAASKAPVEAVRELAKSLRAVI